MLTRGAAPLPKAPIRPGPSRLMTALVLELKVSPRGNKMRLGPARLLLFVASKSLLVRTAAPAGQPPAPATGSELPPQSVLAANTVFGSATVIWILVLTVLAPSNAVTHTV